MKRREFWATVLIVAGLAAVAAPAEASYPPAATGRIFFSGETFQGAKLDIWSMKADGTDVRDLTPGQTGSDTLPAVSPNGRIVAFSSNRGGTVDDDLWLMNPDGTNLRNITPNDRGYQEEPAFSPDGKKIVFSSSVTPTNNDIVIANLDGSGQVNLTNTPGFETAPAWSPDGRKILFESARIVGNGVDIWSMNPDGTGVVNLTPFPGLDASPDVSPKGDLITFTAFRSGVKDEVYVMGNNGSNPRRIVAPPAVGRDAYPAFSPDGTKIAFGSGRQDGVGYADIFLVNPDGSGLLNLKPSDSPVLLETQPTYESIFTCRKHRATIVGDAGPDRITGTRGRDVIVANGGKDTIKAGAGKDLVCAGPGNDKVRGGSGNDRLYGQRGKDRVAGGAGRDIASGGTPKRNPL